MRFTYYGICGYKQCHKAVFDDIDFVSSIDMAFCNGDCYRAEVLDRSWIGHNRSTYKALIQDGDDL